MSDMDAVERVARAIEVAANDWLNANPLSVWDDIPYEVLAEASISALPQGEPVAYLDWHPMVGHHFMLADCAKLKSGEAGRIPLYAARPLPAPPEVKP